MMRQKLNCPNCGHPIEDVTCSYCGTVFYDFANINDDKPSYIRLRWMNGIHIFKCKMIGGEATVKPDEFPLIDLQFVILPDDEGVLIRRMAEGDNHEED